MPHLYYLPSMKYLACLTSLFLVLSCTSQPDPSLANIFAPWDGKWKGEFIIYEDSLGQQEGKPFPEIRSLEELQTLPLKETFRVQVKQEYISETPFYQTVKIQDTYAEADGKLKTVTSTGYNKVEGSDILCVVNKPEEQVIHSGKVPAPNTIIWSRDLRDPELKIEYFYEKVEEDTYYIVGWGYYGSDDPEKQPKMWFYAAYERP